MEQNFPSHDDVENLVYHTYNMTRKLDFFFRELNGLKKSPQIHFSRKNSNVKYTQLFNNIAKPILSLRPNIQISEFFMLKKKKTFN